MRSRFARCLLITALIAPCASQAQQGFFARLNETTPVGVASKSARDEGWFTGAWDGTKRIAREGNWDLYLSGYAWHMPYKYDKDDRNDQNHNAWGLGLGKALIDERDNERSLYALITKDSHYKPQYMAGYAWVARWGIGGPFKVGAGYTAFVMARADYSNYMPFPAALPLVSVGTNRFTLYGTYIPFSDVAYFFGKISFR